MKIIKKILFVLLIMSMLGVFIGCTTDTQPIDSTTETTTNSHDTTQSSELKTMVIYPQPGVTNATVNGIPVTTGQENRIQVNINQPLVTAKYSYTNLQGVLTETSYDLQTYYEFHVLKANGGWASTMHAGAFENDKISK